MKLLSYLLYSFMILSLTACLDLDDDDDDDSNVTLQTQTITTEALDEAVAYIDQSLPEYGSASTAAYFMTESKNRLLASVKNLSPIALANAAANPANAPTATATLADAWDGSVAQYLISPPGGFPQTNETYPNTTDPVDYMNLKEHIGKQLESNFSRASGDDGSFKPTIFGRFDSALDISGILVALLPDGIKTGESTVYVKLVNDEPTASTSDDPNAAPVNLKVIDVSGSNSLYDLAIYIQSDALSVEDWVWLRNTSAALNFQQLEFKTVNNEDDDNITVAAGDIDRTSVTTLNWNRTSGEMLFEYVSIDDENENYTDVNGSAMRLYVEKTDGEAHLIAFEGDVAGDTTRNEFKIFSISTEGGDSVTEAILSVNFNTKDKDQNDYHVAGTDFCVSMENGSATSGCTGLNNANLDFSSSFPAFVSNIIAMDEAQDILDAMNIGTWTTAAGVRNGSAPQFTDSSDISSGFSSN